MEVVATVSKPQFYDQKISLTAFLSESIFNSLNLNKNCVCCISKDNKTLGYVAVSCDYDVVSSPRLILNSKMMSELGLKVKDQVCIRPCFNELPNAESVSLKLRFSGNKPSLEDVKKCIRDGLENSSYPVKINHEMGFILQTDNMTGLYATVVSGSVSYELLCPNTRIRFKFKGVRGKWINLNDPTSGNNQTTPNNQTGLMNNQTAPVNNGLFRSSHFWELVLFLIKKLFFS